ncbi:MAG TPA: hypothetical protein VGS97_16160 [Actinocrinis sp.]|uniref:hypothetical protein n=1 Tax=Actinocrinis sp. TaxID=1920516 RepID=UPI002DDD2DA2|nr:hypothetical protein [Actinocrinis sp.]HEV2345633.1 hypothetical protein [Actinocrinis sp.]
MIDVEAILGSLAAQGVTALLKADAGRMAEDGPAWTFVANCALLDAPPIRVDAATVEDCIRKVIPRHQVIGIAIPTITDADDDAADVSLR